MTVPRPGFWLAFVLLGLAACESAVSTTPSRVSQSPERSHLGSSPYVYIAAAELFSSETYKAGDIEVYGNGGRSFVRHLHVIYDSPYSMQVDSSGNLYVLATGSGGVPGVAVYAPGAGKLLRKMPGVGCGAAIALDHSDNVYALDRCGFVYVFKAGGTSLLRKITAGLERPAAIAIDRDGTLYAANQQNNTITVYPAGTTTPSRTITAGVVAPRALALDRSSNLYVVNEGNVTVYASGSSSVLRTIARGLPLAIVIDSEGFVYVALHAPDRILVFRNNSDRAAYSIRQSLHTPYALALDSAGNLYVDNMFGKSVTVYAKLSNKLLSTISGAFELPYAFAVGPSQ